MRQGCNLSPTLFNILLIKAARRIQRTEVGILLDKEILSILVYADDIAIIARSPDGAKQALEELKEACGEIGMTISVKKSQAVKSKHVGVVSIRDYPLATVLVYKYLGVKIQLNTTYYMLDYSADRAAKANTYCLSTIALAKDSPCPTLFAWRIWTTVAIPAIMYGCEAVLIRKKELDDIEKAQARLAKFMLQVPQSTSNVVAQVLANFEPIEVIYWRRVLKFYGELHVQDQKTWQYKAFREMMNMEEPIHYCRQIQIMLDRLDLEHPRDLESKLLQYSADITNQKLEKDNSTCFALARVTAQETTRKSPFLRRDQTAKLYHELITMNASLGNRKKRDNEAYRFLDCPLCEESELCFNELHLLYECKILEEERILSGIRLFIENNEQLSCTEMHRRFLSGEDVVKRLEAARILLDKYFELIETPIHN